MAAIWLSAAVALRQDVGIAAMEDRTAIYEIRVCLTPGLLAHIHLGKRGAQCIAGDRSGQWVAIARCAEESTVHVFLPAPGFEAALPAHASADPIFLSFPLSHSHRQKFAWTTSLLARAQRDTTPCHSLTDSLSPPPTADSLCRTQTGCPSPRPRPRPSPRPAAADTHHASCAVAGTTVRSAELD